MEAFCYANIRLSKGFDYLVKAKESALLPKIPSYTQKKLKRSQIPSWQQILGLKPLKVNELNGWEVFAER